MGLVLVPPMRELPARPRGAVVRVASGEAMGTAWSARIAAADVELDAVRVAIQAALDRVDAQMSPWKRGSALSRFNAASPGELHELPAEMDEVLGLALQVAGETGGAFDPTLGRLTGLWGFGPAPFSGAPPDPAPLNAAHAQAGWRRLSWQDGRLRQPGGLALDLCGVAKGYAADLAAEAIETLGVRSYLLEVGGEVRGCGLKPDAQPWWVALEHPAAVDGDSLLIAACGVAIATSGGGRRHFERAGRRYSHTLDPASGEPVRETVLAATVLHPRCASADALATALIVMGAERALEFAARCELPAVLTFASETGRRRVLSPAAEAMTVED